MGNARNVTTSRRRDSLVWTCARECLHLQVKFASVGPTLAAVAIGLVMARHLQTFLE